VNVWNKSGVAKVIAASGRAVQESCISVGEYQLLYNYLRDRYADRLVLTFAQIEDLVGFSLPDAARFQPEWWRVSGSASGHSAQSDSWVLAGRTAVVNLSASIVMFERSTVTP
jgi:hypothetical protein